MKAFIKNQAVSLLVAFAARRASRAQAAWDAGDGTAKAAAEARMFHARMLALQPGASSPFNPVLWEEAERALQIGHYVRNEGSRYVYAPAQCRLLAQAADLFDRFANGDPMMHRRAEECRATAREIATQQERMTYRSRFRHLTT